ncbi:alpha/beta hydrolase [Dactylosporangium sp. NPDC050588]|uniref:alpha/beta fold hydrolase n=1 Tax=Dactylosporangium sp. NPDC050588 TaxID=3157211 RepID=UPI0034091EB5
MLTRDGCRLWTEVGGDGPPLVFCHGGPGLWDMAGDLAAMFAGHHRTVRWDQRGCGRSERRGPYTLDQSLQDLDDVIEEHAGGGATLLGHSWGAHLALEYALRHPDRVERLVYVAGTGIDDEDTWKPAFRRNLGVVLGGWDRASVVRLWTAEFPDRERAVAHAEAMATPWFDINRECGAAINAEIARRLRETDLAARCRELRVPVLVVDGSADLRPRSAVDSLVAALPDVRRVVLEGASHLPWVEDPDGFSGAVLGEPRR